MLLSPCELTASKSGHAKVLPRSINQSCIFRVVKGIKSLQDPLEVGNNLPGINDNVRERSLDRNVLNADRRLTEMGLISRYPVGCSRRPDSALCCRGSKNPPNTWFLGLQNLRYDTRCYFNVCPTADIGQLNLLHGTND